MQSRPRLALSLALAAGLMGGCGKSSDRITSPQGPALDQAQISLTLAGYPWVAEDGVFAPEVLAKSRLGPAVGGWPGPDAVQSPIEPFFWWRDIVRVERSFDFQFGDYRNGVPHSARVTVRKHLRGTFNIAVEPDTSGGPADPAVVSKPLDDLWSRLAVFERVDTCDDVANCNPWILTAVSPVWVMSLDPRDCIACKTSLLRLALTAGGNTYPVEDPRAATPLEKLPAFPAGTLVTVTAQTLHPDDVVVVMFLGRTVSMVNNGDGTYSGSFQVPFWRAPDGAVLHVGVNALAHGTVFDDHYLYDSDAWVVPFRFGSPPPS